MPEGRINYDYPFPTLHLKHCPEITTGRLVHFLNNWRVITQDNWVLQTISGYKIPFTSNPRQWRPRITRARTPKQTHLMEEAIQTLLQKKAVKEVQPIGNQFISSLFLVEKDKNRGEYRPIINLKPLNRFVENWSFKMEGLPVVCSLIQPNDSMMKLDLKDAYYSVPVHAEHRKFLRFAYGGKTFEFQCLPFGLTSAPRAFTRLMTPVIAHIRSLGIRVVIYLDDILLLHQDAKVLHSIFKKVVNLLEALGFIINLEKCSQGPSQQLIFLGTMLNSVTMTLSLPSEKLSRIRKDSHLLYTNRESTLLDLATLLGRLSHASQNGIWLAPLHYRALQRVHTAVIHQYGYRARQQSLTLTPDALKDLEWWLSQEPTGNNRQSLRRPPFDLTIHSDASLKGWGAIANNVSIGEHWSPEESRLHINVLELKAAYLAIQAFTKHRETTPSHIHLRVDNSTAVAYINRRGGTRSPTLSEIALDLWSYILKIGSWVTATHIPGVLNVDADTASRQFNPRIEWTLNTEIFQQIVERFYLPEIDLFASRLTHRVRKYVSRYPDPGAIAVDAFLQDWGRWRSLIHPPVTLLLRVIAKIRDDKASALLIAPNWPNQPWYPQLGQMLVDYPLLLPKSRFLLYLPFDPQVHHPLWASLHLTVWPVSGDGLKQQAFRQMSFRSCSHRGENQPRRGMQDLGELGQSGAQFVDGVPFQHL